MSFLSAIFLWALPLAAAPVVIHLLHRRQQKVIRWGAMQFLVDATRRQRRYWRVDDWLLMLLRCAAVLALVFALARPLVRASWLGSGPQRDVILVLDVSMSMGRTSGEVTPFDRLQAHVETTFQQLSSHDSLQVVLAAATPQWQTAEPVPAKSPAASALRERLRALEPSHGPANLLAGLEQALTADSSSGAQSRLITVITDGQAHGLPADGEIAAARLSQLLSKSRIPTAINYLDVGESSLEVRNVGVESLEADRVLAGVGERIELRARVTNYGTSAVESCPLNWTIDGESLSVSFVEPLIPGQTATVTLEHQLEEIGVSALECRVDFEDELPADNSAKLILEARNKLPILVVSSATADARDEDAKYVLAALGGTNLTATTGAAAFFEPTLVEPGDLERRNLSDSLGIVWIDVGPVSEQVAVRLQQFVTAGGGLWLALGSGTDAAEFNQTLASAANGLSPVALGDAIGEDRLDAEFTALHPPSDRHPATALLADTARLDILEARLFRRWRWQPLRAEEKLSVLLETDRGEAVAVERFLGRGRVIVQAIPLTRSWSSVTLCKLFVPYVQETLRYLVQPATGARNLIINSPLVWRRPSDSTEVQALLHAPLQEPIALAPNVEQDELAYRYFNTVFPGDYSLQVEGEDRAALFHVQRDPQESDLTPWPDAQRNAFHNVPGFQFGRQPLDWPAAVTATAPPAPAWSWCLIALAALIGLEIGSICWFAWRKSLIARLPAATVGVSP